MKFNKKGRKKTQRNNMKFHSQSHSSDDGQHCLNMNVGDDIRIRQNY